MIGFEPSTYQIDLASSCFIQHSLWQMFLPSSGRLGPYLVPKLIRIPKDTWGYPTTIASINRYCLCRTIILGCIMFDLELKNLYICDGYYTFHISHQFRRYLYFVFTFITFPLFHQCLWNQSILKCEEPRLALFHFRRVTFSMCEIYSMCEHVRAFFLHCWKTIESYNILSVRMP